MLSDANARSEIHSKTFRKKDYEGAYRGLRLCQLQLQQLVALLQLATFKSKRFEVLGGLHEAFTVLKRGGWNM